MIDTGIASLPSFISHIVQMKEDFSSSPISELEIYIPYCSNERLTTSTIIKVMLRLFISHIVQMKDIATNKTNNIVYYIYIPYCSNESNAGTNNITIQRAFISHIVQMKVISNIKRN